MGKKIKIIVVIGARPQFIKHAALEIAVNSKFDIVTIHTGQHYDKNMSDIFFEELKIKPPTYTLNIGSANHGNQTGQMMIEIEKIIEHEIPDFLLVYGDTNSTISGALVASKLNIPIIHIEAGLRSYNRKMPEEINRVLTDHLSQLLFCPTETAIENLLKEGIVENCFNVGDVMFDMIRISKERKIVTENNFHEFYFATIHRPYNTDNKDRLVYLLNSLNSLTRKVVFSIHPRTKHKMELWGIEFDLFPNIQFIDPVSYFESLNYQLNSTAIITDSGGIQKEAYILKKKCVTIRTETEWIETLEGNWNTLMFEDLTNLQVVLNDKMSHYSANIYGDGYAAEKILKIIYKYIKGEI